MSLQQDLLKIKKEKRLKYKEIGEAIGVSESYAFYLANSKRRMRNKFRLPVRNFIDRIKNSSIEEINSILKSKNE